MLNNLFCIGGPHFLKSTHNIGSSNPSWPPKKDVKFQRISLKIVLLIEIKFSNSLIQSTVDRNKVFK